MQLVEQILVRALVLVGAAVTVAACGQSGALYLPTSAAAANRATLPQSLLPGDTLTQPVQTKQLIQPESAQPKASAAR